MDSRVRLIVSGSRDICNEILVCGILQRYYVEVFDFDVDAVITGGARGVDSIAHKWARLIGLRTIVRNADWDRYGKSAGPIRNREMLEYGNTLLAIWNGKSKGTKDMIDISLKRGVVTYVERI